MYSKISPMNRKHAKLEDLPLDDLEWQIYIPYID
jgi:hypothetical protein